MSPRIWHLCAFPTVGGNLRMRYPLQPSVCRSFDTGRHGRYRGVSKVGVPNAFHFSTPKLEKYYPKVIRGTFFDTKIIKSISPDGVFRHQYVLTRHAKSNESELKIWYRCVEVSTHRPPSRVSACRAVDTLCAFSYSVRRA